MTIVKFQLVYVYSSMTGDLIPKAEHYERANSLIQEIESIVVPVGATVWVEKR